MKYGKVTLGQVEAAINKLGGQEAWDAWLRGEKTVTVKDTIRLLFDKHGRRIPEGLHTNVRNPYKGFQLDQPKMKTKTDFVSRLGQLHWCLGIVTGVTAEQLKTGTERLLAIIGDNPQIANITNGVYLPIVLPKLVNDDLGAELEMYLAGAANSYAKTFGDREFRNRRKGILENEASVVDGSRHDQLIERMKKGPVIGLHFPNPLQGFSINAAREQMSTLPEGFILSGMDTLIAMTMYPDILARDWNTPGLDLAALQWQSAAYSYSFGFKADDNGIIFDCTSVAPDYVCYSGGLLFFG